jgi:putative nucleotidyltransferase with HDIG domain
LKIISFERIRDEVNKIMLSTKPSIGFKLLLRTGLLEEFFPEMVALHGVKYKNGQGHKDNFYHTLKVLDNLAEESDDLWLRWAALLHDIAKPATQRFDNNQGWTFHGHEDLGSRWVPKIFKRFRLPGDHRMKYVQKLVRLHLRPIALTKDEVSDSAVRRLLFDAGDDIDDLLVLCKSDITSKNEFKVKRYRDNFEKLKLKLAEVEESDKLRNWQPPVSGEVIMTYFGIGPSKQVGLIKNAIREAILEGDISNNHEEALELMKTKGEELGLKKN